MAQTNEGRIFTLVAKGSRHTVEVDNIIFNLTTASTTQN